ncbi:hypothetical protein KQ51_00692 [Candidatus Izimaplasma bacterium HR1]|jgi:hypothetical protein|uniref:hypothetical protein n=1 Tax=Candidatus Izimoplasma sp. HR1 TaxID=1541959 RepID=UPI0004F8FEAD|nr:hypothetical protein KQ51_00692 [Candidatus Izimaplasma bacterium HR1]
MSKTKEEVQKLLEKNYQAVQVAELGVYDKNVEVNKVFTKSIKDLGANLKTELEELQDEQKTVKTDFVKKVSDINATTKEKNAKIEANKTKVNKTYESAIKSIEDSFQKELARLNEEIAQLSLDNDTLINEVLENYTKDVEASTKAITSINEKGEKDQAILTKKIEDIKVKQDAKVSELSRKEQDKISKLEEASNKEVSKQEEILAEERQKIDTKLAQLKPVYEEELEEIEENIQEKNDEFNAKKESIRSSADQRIVVREKHLQRALKDNDNRSAKQHKKDIEKFRKEAERDLVLLSKTYKTDSEQATVYRLNFVKDNLEKLADYERDFADYEHEKQKDIDVLKAVLVNNIDNTKLDFEKQIAEETDNYNKSFNDVREKQEEAIKDQELEVELEEAKQIKLEIEFNKDNKFNEQKHNENNEVKEKDLRDVSIIKEKDEMISKDTLDVDLSTLNNEQGILNYEQARDLEVFKLQEKIENHKAENQRLNANKNEFYTYQSALEPLFKTRASEMFKFEEQELTNRYQIKLGYLEKQLVLVEQDYEVIKGKINAVLEVERAPFEKIINSIAGDLKTELEQLEETFNLEVQELNDKIAPLTERKDRRERTELEDKLTSVKENFEFDRKRKEAHINEETKVYQKALDYAVNRNQTALVEAEELFVNEKENISKAIDMLNSNKIVELDDAKYRHQSTESAVQDFNTKAASRNTLNTEENQAYLDAEIAYEQHIVNEENSRFEQLKEATNNSYNKTLKSLEEEKETALNEATNKLSEQESNLESFKQNVENSKHDIQKEADKLLEEESHKTSKNNQAINQKHHEKQNELEDNLKKQESEFKHDLNELSKKISQENDKLEATEKHIIKEADHKLKESIQVINKKLQEDISNI